MRAVLATRRDEADQILAAAESRAQTLSDLASESDHAFARARIDHLHHLRAEIESHQERIEHAYAAMAEAMASAAMQLTLAARSADFSIPSWPEGIRSSFELKLTETREMTIRVATDTTAGARSVEGSRLAPIEHQESR